MPRQALRTVPIIGRRPAPYALGTRFAVFGDSRTQNTFSGSGTFLESAKWADRLISAARGRVTILPADDYGVGGDTTGDMLARIAAVTASSASIVCILGGTNDRGSAAMSLAQSKANMTTMIDAILASGKSVVVCSEWQRFAGNALNGAQLQNHIDFHGWLQGLWHPRLEVANCWDNIGTADLFDGLHAYTQGAHKCGEAFGAAIARLVKSDEVLPLASGNVVVNGVLAGTGGAKSNVTGEVADNWTASKSTTNAGTLAAAGDKVLSDGQQWQRFVFSGAPTGTHTTEFRQDVTLAAAGLSVGDTVEALCEFVVDGASNVSGFPLRLRGLQSDATTITGTVEHGDYDGTQAGSLIPDGPWSGVRRTPQFTIPALTDRLRVSVVVQLIALTVSFTVRLANFAIRKVA